ncbi:uncharacterized protein LOC143003395 [Genypterus blacodes]|uniref:uncharacterized protein LOC143003395 n=1 Tax=Genypterus blacodes TaxID=154954 RepID=UPI003F75C830
MAATHRSWMVVLLLAVSTGDSGVYGRAVDTRGFVGDEAHRGALRAGRGAPEEEGAHRERCAELEAPWLENAQPSRDDDTRIQIRVRPFPNGGSPGGTVFPGKSLFSFVRRVYRCCQEGFHCRSARGIQGRFRGDTHVEFLLSEEVLSRSVVRAEIHLQLSNPQRLDVQPLLSAMAKRNLPTRFSSWSHGDTVELRVDLLFLFQGLQEVVGGARGGPSLVNVRNSAFPSTGGPPAERATVGPLQDVELGLVLGCSQDGSAASCGGAGVHLLHTPFIALSYR